MDKDNRLGLGRKLMILGKRSLLYMLLYISHILLHLLFRNIVRFEIKKTDQYPSLAILYEPCHLLVAVVADDDDHRMGSLVGKSFQIELVPVGGKGGIGECSVESL